MMRRTRSTAQKKKGRLYGDRNPLRGVQRALACRARSDWNVSVIRISARMDFDRVLNGLQRLPDSVREKVEAMAINKVAAKAKSEMKRQITATYNIKSGEVGNALSVSKASPKRFVVEATLRAFGSRSRSGRALNLIHFAARQVKGKAGKTVHVQIGGKWVTLKVPVGGGVSVKVLKSGGRQLLAHAFIGNDGRTVFTRTGDARLPIKALQTIDVPQMFNARKIISPVLDKIRADLPIEVRRAIQAATARGWLS